MEFVLNTLGMLWLAGTSIEWSGFMPRSVATACRCPPYPFERERYWIEPPLRLAEPEPQQSAHPVQSDKTPEPAKKLTLIDWDAAPTCQLPSNQWSQSSPR
jgi:acyl transferase domain-containing protein